MPIELSPALLEKVPMVLDMDKRGVSPNDILRYVWERDRGVSWPGWNEAASELRLIRAWMAEIITEALKKK